MFNIKTWQSMSEYQNLVSSVVHKLKRNPTYETTIYKSEIDKMLHINLDPVGEYLRIYYSSTGRPAQNQAQIFRSFILFTMLFNKTPAKQSLTLWVRDVLPSNPLFITLVGCESANNLPPLGSYYDFINRLWKASKNKYSISNLLPAGKNGKKPKKEIGNDGKLIEDPKYKTQDFVDKILSDTPLSDNPEAILQDIFFIFATLPSMRLGLIPQNNLTLSGDGTAVASHSNPFGHILAGCDSLRHYSDPDAEIGWDSHEKTWYFGHTLYTLCSYNEQLGIDLPVSIKFTSARRHDSINFLYCFDEFTKHSPGIKPENLCLDSAHDNMPTYRLLNEFNINALIDLNGRSSSSEGLPNDITLNKQGHPLCRCGKEMCAWGKDPNKNNAHKFRCPLKCGKIDTCPFEQECCKGNYGRTVYIHEDNDLRFYPRIPRDSDLFKAIYNKRTSCERMNNRILNDYGLLNLKIRGINHFSFWTMIICICIHLNARQKVSF